MEGSVASVSAFEFLNAVSKIAKMKRSPNGSRKKAPRDAIISSDKKGKLSVDTPIMTSTIDYSGTWSGEISLDARLLFEKTNALLRPKKGEPNIEKIHIWKTEGSLWIKGLTEISIPEL